MARSNALEPDVSPVLAGMAFPNLFIVGAPRCGTTSLYSYLGQHEQIEMSPQKEAGFLHFANGRPDFDEMAARNGASLKSESIARYRRAERRSVIDETEYLKLWKVDSRSPVRGEATPTYLLDPSVPGHLRNRWPESRIIVILRNPVDRAYSEYLQSIRLGVERHSTFEEAIAAEPVDVDDFWWGARKYIRSGFYARHLRRFLDVWPREHVKVFFHEQLIQDVEGLLRDCFRFLEIDPRARIDSSTRYKSGFVPAPSPLVRVAQSESAIKRLVRTSVPAATRRILYHKIMSRRQIAPPPLTPSTRSRLMAGFRNDIKGLQEIVGRDLRGWM